MNKEEIENLFDDLVYNGCINLNFYTHKCREFVVSPACETEEYLILGLISEVGEIAGKIKKRIRGDAKYLRKYNVFIDDIKNEFGDVFWYLMLLLHHYRIDVKEVLVKNIVKLTERKKNSTLQGSGDDR